MATTDGQRQLDAQQNTLHTVEVSLRALLAVSQRDLSSQLEPLQQASVHLTLAHTVSALYQAFLRLHGVDLAGSPFAKDVERLRLYDKKLQKAESEQWLKEHRPSLSVSVAAANRFISAAIPDLTPEQRKALRKVGRKEKPTPTKGAPAPPAGAPAERRDARQEAFAFLDSVQADAGEHAVPTGPAERDSLGSRDLMQPQVKKKKKRKMAAAAAEELAAAGPSAAAGDATADGAPAEMLSAKRKKKKKKRASQLDAVQG